MEIGDPLCHFTIAEVCQPPTKASSSLLPLSQRLPFPNGSSTITFELMTWPVWKSDRPSSSSGRALSRNGSMRDCAVPTASARVSLHV